MICHKCQKDISENQFEHNSEIDGHLDIGYDCTDCQITIYVLKVERLEEE